VGPQPEVDLVLRGGTVIDGTGAPARSADVAVRDGRIHAVGQPGALRAARAIDASGLVVAPGFVDLHSHADLILLADRATQERLLAAKLAQGITTVIVGNCGLGVAPTSPDAGPILAAINGWMTPDGVVAGPQRIGDYLDALESRGVVLNAGTLVPHGPARVSSMGLAAGAPSDEQLDAMRRDVRNGLQQGAFGLSAGLIYPPGMYSATEELVELARVVAAADRLFTAHVRGSSETLLPATRELIEIARRSGARVHHSHLEAVGERYWPDVARVLALEDAARAEGLRISHDVFPYTRAATMMSAIFPPWALEGGLPALLDRLADPDARQRLRGELATRVPQWPPWREGGWPHNLVGAVGWDGIRVASVGAGGPLQLVGRSLDEIAAERGGHPFDVVAELMRSQQGRVGQLVDEISGRGERIEALLSILAHPAAAVVSDAEDYGRGAPHPAHAGAFARALRLNRERSLMPPEDLVRRMTSYPASLIGLDDRGVISPGAHADLVVLDPRRVTDRATWEAPRLAAEGIRWVLVNGAIAVEDGRYVGGLHGRVLRARADRR
jgi:N-acyl-D-aspartate/D-glutamate deacylase